jgi:hypothetical protein
MGCSFGQEQENQAEQSPNEVMIRTGVGKRKESRVRME